MEVHLKQNWFDGYSFHERSKHKDDLRTIPGHKRSALPKSATIIKDDHVPVSAEVDAEKVVDKKGPAEIDPTKGISAREFDTERKDAEAEQKKLDDATAKQAEIERLEKADAEAKKEEDRKARAQRLQKQAEREAAEAAGAAGKK